MTENGYTSDSISFFSLSTRVRVVQIISADSVASSGQKIYARNRDRIPRDRIPPGTGISVPEIGYLPVPEIGYLPGTGITVSEIGYLSVETR